jgi:uncharacterized protein
MAKGISVYFGEQNFFEIEKYVHLACSLGYKKVFTSIHLPEVDFKPLLNDFFKLGKLCNKLEMQLMVDISPKTFSYFSYEEFLRYMEKSCVNLIRIDFGLSNEVIVKLSNSDKSFKIALNASTLLPDAFEVLVSEGLNINNIEMCHNFYPRPETGISEDFFLEQTNYYKKNKLEISAFIPAKSGKRPPVFEGLPTLEKHRELKSSLAFRHLQLLGINNIYLGDNKIIESELTSISQLNDSAIALESEIDTDNPNIINMLKQIHTDRPDSSECVIRSQESRLTLSSGSFKNKSVEPCNTIKREIGDITIDNNLYERYAGELQICRKNLKQDKRVNIIGKINKDNHFLLSYIERSKKYYFVDQMEY